MRSSEPTSMPAAGGPRFRVLRRKMPSLQLDTAALQDAYYLLRPSLYHFIVLDNLRVRTLRTYGVPCVSLL